jgi:CRISPR-associated endonuclease/helicase Cas3
MSMILDWLRRQVYEGAPRRLVYALPRDVPVEPVAAQMQQALDGKVALHTVMAGAGEADRRWRLDPHRPAVVIGSAEALVSKALNRGHSLSRAMWPIDFALVTNGAHWVVEQPRRSATATATLLRLASFADPAVPGSWPTAEPFTVTLLDDLGPAASRLRREDLLALFDTDTDTDELDATPFVCDGDFDVQVAWVRWTPADPDGRPAPEVRLPEQRLRRLLPARELRALASDVPVWRFDPAAGAWSAVTGGSPLRPGDTVLVAGGDDAPDVDAVPRPPQPGEWLSLQRHGADVRDQVRALLAALRPALPDGAGQAAVVAGHAHDLGKAHPIWQDALCALAGEPEPAWITAGRPWAKSGIDAPLRFRDDLAFRHELGSLVRLDQAPDGMLDVQDPDLVRYLVLAHHGNLRLRIPDADWVTAAGGAPADWTRTATAVRDRYGPFVLAYLELLVRIADWRASAGLPLAV